MTDLEKRIMDTARLVSNEFEASNNAGTPTPGLWDELLELDMLLAQLDGRQSVGSLHKALAGTSAMSPP